MKIINPSSVILDEPDEIEALITLARIATLLASRGTIAGIDEPMRQASLAFAHQLLSVRISIEPEFRG